MASEWQERLLGKLIDNFDGMRVPVKEADRRPGQYPYYGASGVVDHVDNYLFDGEYLLIAEDGENLRTRNTPVAFLARGKFWVNNHAHIVRGNSETDTRFLMYALFFADISAYLTGSTMPKLTQGNMNRIPILTPPLSEQRSIAHILGSLDDKIELNRKMNETLEAMARALFKSWFVDFDPVRAKAEGRDTGLPKEIADLFPDDFEDSDLGEIPKGWGLNKAEELFNILSDTVSPNKFPNEIFDHYSIPAFDEGRCPKTEIGIEIKSNKNRVPEGVVLISKLNPRIPRVWLPILKSEHRAIASTEFLVVLPNNVLTREYLYFLFSSRAFMNMFATFVTGTSGSHQRVKPDYLLNMNIVVPSLHLIKKFSAIVNPMLIRIADNVQESSVLAAIRDTLLPKLISGKIRFTNAAKIASELME